MRVYDICRALLGHEAAEGVKVLNQFLGLFDIFQFVVFKAFAVCLISGSTLQ